MSGICDVNYNELIGAARLSGKRDALFDAFRRLVLTGSPYEMEACLVDRASRNLDRVIGNRYLEGRLRAAIFRSVAKLD